MGENRKYRILQGCYWMMINVIFGYIAFYLSEYGYSAGEIGMLSAAFAALSAVCQPLLGLIADKNSHFGWKPQILLFSMLCCAIFGILFAVKQPIMVGFLFGLVMLFINCIQPMLNAACFYYVKRGISVDFGIARGIGSMAYAFMSLILGYLTVKLGTSAVLYAGIPVLLIQFLVVLRMPYEDMNFTNISQKSACLTDEDSVNVQHINEESESVTEKVKKNSVLRGGFLKKYPIFCLMVVGSVLLVSVHNFMTTYLLKIMESVGGNSSHMGIALAIGAVTEIPVLFLFSHIVKRISASSLLVISGVAYIAKSLMFFLAGNVGMIYGAHFLQPFSYALYASASVYFANECMQEEDKITGQSLMTMTMAFGSLVGNLVGGWFIDLSGVKAMLAFSSILSIFSVIVIAIAAGLHRRKSL